MRELEEIIESCRQDDASELSPSDSDDLIRNCGLLLQVFLKLIPLFRPICTIPCISLTLHVNVQSRVEQIISECSDVGLLEDQEFGNFSFNLSVTVFFFTGQSILLVGL